MGDKEGTRSISGEIEFSRPVVVVIAMSRKLEGSDALFGNPDVDYGGFHGRGLEREDHAFDERILRIDELLLSQNSRRLYFSLHVGQLHDYVRILVKSND